MVEIILQINYLLLYTVWCTTCRSGVERIEKLPSSVQLQLTSLLLSAVMIDHDTKSNGVLSCLLLNSVMATFRTVHREIQAEHANRYVQHIINNI